MEDNSLEVNFSIGENELNAELNLKSLHENDYNRLVNLPEVNNKQIKGSQDSSYYNLEDLRNKVSEINEENKESTSLYGNLKAISNYVNEYGSKIDFIDVNDTEQQIINKRAKIEINKSTVGLNNVDNTSDLNKPISTLQQSALDLKLNLSNANTNIMTDSDILQNGDNVSIEKTYRNLATQTTSTNTTAIPLADNENGGLMSSADYAQLQQNTADIAILKQQTIRILYTAKTNPTAQEIQDFVISKGYTQDKWPLVGVVVKDTNYVWRYYTTDGWVQQTDVVSQFKEGVPGTITGSTTDGRIFAESNGEGSVYGWDSLKNRVSNMETNKAEKSELAPIATVQIPGKVKPDGTTITIDLDGTIHSQGGGTSTNVKINGQSITQNNEANIITKSAYDAETNPIMTENDGVGKKSVEEGSEYFNDYENNKADAPYTHAEGKETTAGINGLEFTGFTRNVEQGIYTLNINETPREVAIGKTFSMFVDNGTKSFNFEDVGEIINWQRGAGTSFILNVTNLPDLTDYESLVQGYIWVAYPPIPIGTYTVGLGAHAEGYQNAAAQIGSHSEGANNISSGKYSHTEGLENRANYSAHAEGQGNKSLGFFAHTEGYKNTVAITSNQSHSEGSNNTIESLTNDVIYASHAEGNRNTVNSSFAHAEGQSNTVTGTSAHAEGETSTVSGNYAHSEGKSNIASGQASHTEGQSNTSSGNASHSEGNETEASGLASHAEGIATVASSQASHAEGNGSLSSGNASHSEGTGSLASGNSAHAEGNNTQATAINTHAEGVSSRAISNQAHAEGTWTIAGKDSGTGLAAHSEGRYTEASGNASHAEGYGEASGKNIASGQGSHAEGESTQATAEASHAEGRLCKTFGKYSHSEGFGNTIKANANQSHAEGSNNTIGEDGGSEIYAVHVEGNNNTATGGFSHAEGEGTIASSIHQHVQGKYNIADSQGTYAHIVGNGTNNTNRSNAHTLDWSGNAYFAGNIRASGLTDGVNTKTMSQILNGSTIPLYSTTGQNTDGAMTQKATTDELTALSNNIDLLGQQISNPNLLINGDFKINQRGESVYSTVDKYTVDRWHMGNNLGTTVTKLDNGIRLYGISNDKHNLTQKIEDTKSLENKTITFSINFANNTDSFKIGIYDNNGITTSDVITYSNGSAKVTRTIGNGLTTLRCIVLLETTGANMSVDILNAKLELGNVATPFTPRTYAEELALCQRYYYQLNSENNYDLFGIGLCRSANEARFMINLHQPMRVKPTISVNAVNDFYMNDGTSDFQLDRLIVNMSNKDFVSLKAILPANSLTVGRGIMLIANNNTNAKLFLDAEM